jgi:hypothetical protein
MSRIDRRAFVVGCLAVPLAGCPNPDRTSSLARSSGLSYPKFLNCGSWLNNNVFVVNGGIQPGGGIACANNLNAGIKS